MISELTKNCKILNLNSLSPIVKPAYAETATCRQVVIWLNHKF